MYSVPAYYQLPERPSQPCAWFLTEGGDRFRAFMTLPLKVITVEEKTHIKRLAGAYLVDIPVCGQHCGIILLPY